MSMNVTNLIEVQDRSVIKQGNYASVFVFELQDDRGNIVTALNGQTAITSLATNDDKVVYQQTSTVTNSQIEFSIDSVLEPDTYSIEVSCNGYIFPSGHRQKTITVTPAHKVSAGAVDVDSLSDDYLALYLENSK